MQKYGRGVHGPERRRLICQTARPVQQARLGQADQRFRQGVTWSEWAGCARESGRGRRALRCSRRGRSAGGRRASATAATRAAAGAARREQRSARRPRPDSRGATGPLGPSDTLAKPLVGLAQSGLLNRSSGLANKPAFVLVREHPCRIFASGEGQHYYENKRDPGNDAMTQNRTPPGGLSACPLIRILRHHKGTHKPRSANGLTMLRPATHWPMRQWLIGHWPIGHWLILTPSWPSGPARPAANRSSRSPWPWPRSKRCGRQ